MSTLVSIVIPVFNSENYISDCITSVLNQTHKHWELILVDDCSSDSSSIIIKSFAKLDKRIKFISLSENSGAAVARNTAIAIAKGRYIAFLDSDDLWLPDKLSNQIVFMSENNYAISHTSYVHIDSFGNSVPGGVSVSNSVNLIRYMKTTEIGMSTSMIDRLLCPNVSFYNIRTRQDTMLWLGLLDKGFVSYGLPLVLTQYRISNSQISRNKFKMIFNTFIVFNSVQSISFVHRLYLFSCYIFSGIMKRL